MDDIIDKLGGPKNVAEMTGRKGRIVRHSPQETPRYELRTPNAESYGGIESLNVQEVGSLFRLHRLVVPPLCRPQPIEGKKIQRLFLPKMIK